MTTATLDKKTYPLMMHLSILPKYDISNNQAAYNAETQTSNVNAMSGSWSTNSTSTWKTFSPNDSDSQEDD